QFVAEVAEEHFHPIRVGTRHDPHLQGGEADFAQVFSSNGFKALTSGAASQPASEPRLSPMTLQGADTIADQQTRPEIQAFSAFDGRLDRTRQSSRIDRGIITGQGP